MMIAILIHTQVLILVILHPELIIILTIQLIQLQMDVRKVLCSFQQEFTIDKAHTAIPHIRIYKIYFLNGVQTVLTSKADSIRFDIVHMKTNGTGELTREPLLKLQKQLNSISEARKHCGRFLNDTDMQQIFIVEFVQEIGDCAQQAIESFNFRVVEKDLQQTQQISDMLSDSSDCCNCKCFKNEQLKRKKRTILDVMQMMKIDGDTELAGISCCDDILFDFSNLMIVSVMVVVLHHQLVFA